MCSINTIIVMLLTYSIRSGNCESYEGDWEAKNALRSDSIFERFIELYLDALSTSLTGKELKRYCKMMSRELVKFEFTYTERLGNHFASLASLSRDDIADEMAAYRRDFDDRSPNRKMFFVLISEAFGPQQDVQFNDYIDDLHKYANADLLFVTILEETRNLLNMIVSNIRKLDRKKRRALEKQLRLTIREYLKDDESSQDESLDLLP